MQNTDKSPTSEIQDKLSESENSSKFKISKKYIYIGAIVLFLLTTIALAAYLLLVNKTVRKELGLEEADKEKEIFEVDVDDNIEEDAGEIEEAEEVTRRIAYMVSSNIWVMDIDGANKTQITFDGDGDATRYTAMNWKEQGILGYAKCDGSCNIYSYDLVTSLETLVETPPPFTQNIYTIAWSHDASILGYIYVKADYSSEAVLINGGTTTITTFAPSPARGGGYNDGIQIRFSPDDTKVIAFNTIIPFEDDTVVITYIDGTPIIAMDDSYFPTFDGNDGFYYKHDGKIKRYDFALATSSEVYNFGTSNGYNLETSPDQNFIAYWNEDASMNDSLYYHDVAGSPSLIANNFANAKWLDSNELIAIKIAGPGIGMGFESAGLSRVTRVTGAEIPLDNSAIYNFEIEPL